MKRIDRRRNLSSIMVQAGSASASARAQREIADLLRQRHRIGAGRDDDFTIRGQEEIANAATATTKTLTVLLGSIASVSLIVGGIGIMNIMLVSVTERTREIGIRMAVGARGHDILLQFLSEALTLSLIGGVIGIGLGIGTCKLLPILPGFFTNFPPMATQVSTPSIILAFISSASIGIFFGFYPARKASRLDPIEALRYE
jgi:putative ABC transport system permease protein